MAAAIVVGMGASANAAIIKSYDFDNGLGDTLGNGNALTASGGTVAGGRYEFGLNQGLRLTDALPSTTDYAMEIKFQVNDSLGGYNKVIDFQDLSSDLGLYVLNGAVDFYTAGPAAGTVALDQDFTLGLARASGTISVYLNGTSLFSVADGGQAVSGGNILNFFEDDVATSQSEAFAGSVDFIRIHDDASTFGQAPPNVSVPLPGVLPQLAAGAGLLGVIGWRRRKAG
ncbi:MAG: hypothetical protein KDC18_09535 [Alphaproteobacteria bacterium]|nr:hypothetical protein [Alphaproteobacteria bacterium]